MGKPRKSNSRIKIRKRWKINPKTRIKESAKRYSRRREKELTHQVIKNATKKNP